MQPRGVSFENGRNYSTSWAPGRIRLWGVGGTCRIHVLGQEPWGPRRALALGTRFIPEQEGDLSPVAVWTAG